MDINITQVSETLVKSREATSALMAQHAAVDGGLGENEASSQSGNIPSTTSPSMGFP